MDYYNEKESETTNYKCPACGAGLEWIIDKQSLGCNHCGHLKVHDKEVDVVLDRLLTDQLLEGQQQQWNEATVYRCNACGAKEVLNKSDLTRICPFCGSTNIVNSDDLVGIKPDSVVPFMITKKQGAGFFTKWLKGKLFAPNACKKSATAEKLNAVYSPVWTFDAETESSYSGTLGRTETRTRTINGRMQTTVETKWFNVSGSIANNYDDYLVESGDKITQDQLQKIQPFDKDYYRPYLQEYLSGYPAEHYNKRLAEGFEEFKTYVKEDLKRKIMRKHGADQCSTLNINTAYNNRKFKYLLLPIYISCFYYKNKLYNFYMNASNGKVTGKYPKSFWKIMAAVFTVGLILGGIAFGIWRYM